MAERVRIVELRDGFEIRVSDPLRMSGWPLIALTCVFAWGVLFGQESPDGLFIALTAGLVLLAGFTALWMVDGHFHMAFVPGQVRCGWSALGVGWTRRFDATRVAEIRVDPYYNPYVVVPAKWRRGAVDFDYTDRHGVRRTINCLAGITAAEAERLLRDTAPRRAALAVRGA